MMLRFDDLDGKAKRTMEMAQVKYVPISVKVVDQSTGSPIEDADVWPPRFIFAHARLGGSLGLSRLAKFSQ